MKRYTALSLFLLIVFAAAVLSHTGRNFRYYADLGHLAAGKLYRIHLTEDVLKKSSLQCADVRIFDRQGREIPRIVIVHRDGQKEPEERDLEIVSYNADTRTVTARFPERTEAVNSITLDIPESDFRRKAVLHGSPDGNSWTFLKRDLIYDYTSTINLRSVTLRFPLSRYRYYRISLAGAGIGGGKTISLKYGDLSFEVDSGGEREIRIDGITASRINGERKEQPFDARDYPGPASVTGDEASVILLMADLPVDKISFHIGNPFYYRRVLLYGGDDKKAGAFLTEGMVFFAPGLEPAERRDWILCSAEKHRYYRFNIVNADNPELRVTKITLQWHPRLLFFMSDREGIYTISFGNSGVKEPDYDLGRYITGDNWQGKQYTDITPGPIRERSDYRPGIPEEIKGQIERWALTAVAVIATGLIGFWLFRLARGARK